MMSWCIRGESAWGTDGDCVKWDCMKEYEDAWGSKRSV